MSVLIKNICSLQKEVSPRQQEILRKILFTNESERIYINSYTGSLSDGTNGEAMGKFLVNGSLRKQVRECYQLTLHLSGNIKCTCPDAIYNGIRYNTFCKHACFLICRVFNLFDADIFKNLALSSEQLSKVLVDCATLSTESVNTVVSVSMNTSSSAFTCVENPPDWICAICYDDTPPILSNLAQCPDCNKSVHRNCMMVWLENHNTCIYCRSMIWQKYKNP